MTNETGDTILKVTGLILAFFTFRWIYKIFSRTDGKRGMTQEEFLKLASFILFYGGIIFILYVEAYRETVEHRFGDFWLAFMITGLFSVLHMTDVIDKMSNLIDLLIRLKTKVSKTETTHTSAVVTQETVKKEDIQKKEVDETTEH
jgi:hypothetical protein